MEDIKHIVKEEIKCNNPKCNATLVEITTNNHFVVCDALVSWKPLTGGNLIFFCWCGKGHGFWSSPNREKEVAAEGESDNDEHLGHPT